MTSRILKSRRRRTLVGIALLFLFGVLGAAGFVHHHDADGTHAQTNCEFCRVSAQPFTALEKIPEVLPWHCPDLIHPLGSQPILAAALPPFSSRAPPTA